MEDQKQWYPLTAVPEVGDRILSSDGKEAVVVTPERYNEVLEQMYPDTSGYAPAEGTGVICYEFEDGTVDLCIAEYHKMVKPYGPGDRVSAGFNPRVHVLGPGPKKKDTENSHENESV